MTKWFVHQRSAGVMQRRSWILFEDIHCWWIRDENLLPAITY